MELTELELARDEVSNVAAAWVQCVADGRGGEDSAITRFDEAMQEFEKAVRRDAAVFWNAN